MISNRAAVRSCSSRRIAISALTTVAALALMLCATSCQPKPIPPSKPIVSNPTLPNDPNLPEFLHGTVKDYTILSNTGPFVVSSYGLVVGLRNTGNSDCPTPVRDWMIKEMFRHGWGSSIPGGEKLSPTQVLADPRTAVVEVGGFIPPGARVGQKFDIVVQALAGNRTSSLARGFLYRCSLRVDGADPALPDGSVNEFAKAQGYLFVNPAYAVNTTPTAPGAAASLRSATIPGGGVVTNARELRLRLREPSWSVARAIEGRITDYFQDKTVAAAQDDAFVFLYTPEQYNGDWQHFEGVVRHLYVNGSVDFLNNKAKQLVLEAVKPNAPLLDISYCWEAMGPLAIRYLTPLLSNKLPEVAYAAARAGSFLNDRFAQDCLLRIAMTPNHAFRLAAIQDFNSMPPSPVINARLSELLSDPEPLVRIAAYTVLARNNDPHILSKVITSENTPDSAFWLDIVESSGPPLVYATRVGEPRVAVFGRKVSMNMPVTFAAFDTRLTISTNIERPRLLTIYYRADDEPKPIQVMSGPDLPELIARLGGVNEDGLHFTYGEVVAMLQSMVDSDKVTGNGPARAQFVLQELPGIQRQINGAPAIPEGNRQQSDTPATPDDSLPILPKPTPVKK